MDIQDLIPVERYKSKCNWIPTDGFVAIQASSIGAKWIGEVGVAPGCHAEQILDTMNDVE